jgi:hypothetical protein
MKTKDIKLLSEDALNHLLKNKELLQTKVNQQYSDFRDINISLVCVLNQVTNAVDTVTKFKVNKEYQRNIDNFLSTILDYSNGVGITSLVIVFNKWQEELLAMEKLVENIKKLFTNTIEIKIL